MTIDWSKPVQTRGGKPVEIITTKGRGSHPVIGYVGYTEILDGWMIDGTYNGKKPTDRDLINVPEERNLWVNVYEDGCSFAHANRDTAEYACSVRLKNSPRIACVHVKYKIGEGLNDNPQ